MGHYSDYYHDQREQRKAYRRKCLTEALDLLRQSEKAANLPCGEIDALHVQYESLEALLMKRLSDLDLY